MTILNKYIINRVLFSNNGLMILCDITIFFSYIYNLTIQKRCFYLEM